VRSPRWRQLAPLPGARREDRAGEHEDPGGDVEQPVRERVVLEGADRCRRAATLAGQHVVPLEDLVEEDAVHETTETDAHEEGGEQGRIDPIGHAQPLPTAEGRKRRVGTVAAKPVVPCEAAGGETRAVEVRPRFTPANGRIEPPRRGRSYSRSPAASRVVESCVGQQAAEAEAPQGANVSVP
jgi:hypothetical protein